MTIVLRSDPNLSFYRERVRQCLELAEVSRSVPSIKSRLEALAQKYQQRIDDLKRTSQASPPLAPDQTSVFRFARKAGERPAIIAD
jgi:hypothetical protein